ncbi:MAG TPA: 2,3-bisphosphoglycerate-independent phosphoglycerate mutase [Candidatus Methanomethylicus sp.]|nr:2,3-bisphosphoglycerate-independent phosphoglycerate mutase [Candidatus Methanomethylicus sp.]
MYAKRLLYVLLDGLGDRPVAKLGRKTPLEASYRPYMNAIAARGSSGVVYTVGKGIAPESDVAVISMLGYDPVKTYTGRGPIEAFGSMMEFNNGNLAVRCNFATVDHEMGIVDRRCGRSLTTEEAKVLADAINREVKLESHPAEFEFMSTVGHRGVLVIRKNTGKLSGNISNTDPAYQKMEGLGLALKSFNNKIAKCEALDETLEAKAAADLLQEFTVKSHDVLEGHPLNKARRDGGKPPANAILSRDAGDRLPDFKKVNALYGVEFASLVEMPVERGIAMLCGMDLVELPKPSGDLAVDYSRRAELASDLLESYGGVYIHIKGPDEPAHDGDCRSKMKSIELIDAHFFRNLKIDYEKTVIIVTADHSTPCEMKAHSDDTVPLVAAGIGIERDGTMEFGETACSRGSLGTLNGQEVITKLFARKQ